jgi:hypothetical protein
MPQANYFWTFFSISEAFNKKNWLEKKIIKRTITRFNVLLRQTGLPAIDNCDYVSFHILEHNIGMKKKDREYFTELLYYHKCLYTLLHTTDFEQRCRAALPRIRRNLIATARKNNYPDSVMLNCLHYITIPGIAASCFRSFSPYLHNCR